MNNIVHAHYNAIAEFYGDKTAERSNVPYINHIKEGLTVLNEIGASDVAKAAYCLHPIFQGDEALKDYATNPDITEILYRHGINTWTFSIVLAMEYRRMANSYLSKDKPENLIKSPLKDVWDMLIADKVQNKKDFLIYHKGKHPRSNELEAYFNKWMEILGITEERYKELSSAIDREKQKG